MVDVERLQIIYRWSDALRVTAGRGHTKLGFWNESYHHGALLQPTVDRPEMLKFEDDGGMLPVHFVGVEVSGRVGRGAWDVSYAGYVANGRGPRPDRVQGAFDGNRNKAFGGVLSFAREGRGSLRVGVSAYHDVIPPETTGRRNELDEALFGAHLVYESGRFLLQSEYFHLRHEELGTGTRLPSDAAYALCVLRFGRWKPYAGIDWLRVDPDDPFFVGYGELTRTLVGLRFDPAAFNALKLEYHHDRRSGGDSHRLVLQSAFAF